MKGLRRYGLKLADQYACQAPVKSTCPICFCDHAEKNLWCGCSVCADCTCQWAKAQLEETGAGDFVLRCPVCRAILRPADAKRALTLKHDVFNKYFDRLLAQALRSDPQYLSCPHCKGGGFRTDACMEQRRAVRWLEFEALQNKVRDFTSVMWLSFWLVTWAAAAGWLSLGWSDLLFLLLGCLSESEHQQARCRLKRALRAPTQVGCPCCEARFVLPGSEDTASSEAWLKQHSRPCPRCKAPIQKSGGCNHMTCSGCSLKFCWACMRPSHVCGAYRCSNGAPFGNASPVVQLPRLPTAGRAADEAPMGTIYGLRVAAVMSVAACCTQMLFGEPATLLVYHAFLDFCRILVVLALLLLLWGLWFAATQDRNIAARPRERVVRAGGLRQALLAV